MTKTELAMLLEEGEGYQLEFKRAVNSDLAKAMVAFANASGGRIIIGIDDTNQVVGTDFTNLALSQIEDVSAGCDPIVPIRLEKCARDRLLIIHVPEAESADRLIASAIWLH